MPLSDQRDIAVPWEFSRPPAEGDTSVPNLPTPEGRMLGAQLARLCDIEEAGVRERFPHAGHRCGDCALRLGTHPNGCAETLMDLVKALVENTPFYCHKSADPAGSSDRLCAGYAILAGTDGPRDQAEQREDDYREISGMEFCAICGVPRGEHPPGPPPGPPSPPPQRHEGVWRPLHEFKPSKQTFEEVLLERDARIAHWRTRAMQAERKIKDAYTVLAK